MQTPMNYPFHLVRDMQILFLSCIKRLLKRKVNYS